MCFPVTKSSIRHRLLAISRDAHTFTVPIADIFALVPLWFGTDPNFAVLVTLQLPQGMVQGQEFAITTRRLATRSVEPVENPRIQDIHAISGV